ncbi:MAG: tetratricopeptide repeat protein [Thaumarchaeota archaeon]|nr:tetratricopeptide repeat protein [Nitrososphaerota archaeon]
MRFSLFEKKKDTRCISCNGKIKDSDDSVMFLESDEGNLYHLHCEPKIKINEKERKTLNMLRLTNNTKLATGKKGGICTIIKPIDDLSEKSNKLNEFQALYDHGLEFAKIGKYEDAIIWYDKAIEINSNDDTLLDNKGIALSTLGKYEESIIWFDKALKINPDHANALKQKEIALENLKIINTKD